MLKKTLNQTVLFATITGMASALLFGYTATVNTPEPSVTTTVALWLLILSIALWVISALLGITLFGKTRK